MEDTHALHKWPINQYRGDVALDDDVKRRWLNQRCLQSPDPNDNEERMRIKNPQ
jgi:hypothetical protein